MNRTQFMQGMGAGLLMGAAVGYAMAPRKKTQMQRMANKAKRAVSDAAENVSNLMS